MRNSFIALFLVCLLGLAAAQQSGCSFSNLFTKQMSKKGVQWTSKPAVSQSYCGVEWSEHGTCCEIDSVQNYVNKEMGSIDKLAAKSKDETRETLQNLKAYKQQFLLLTREGPSLISGVRLKSQQERQKIFQEYHNQMDAIIKWVENHQSSVVDSQSTCLDKFKKVRASSVCYACSGRASTFFNKNELNLHETTCRLIINDCRTGWAEIIEFLDKVNTFYDIIKGVDKDYGLNLADSVKGSPAKQVLDWAKKTGIRDNLQKCTAANCDFETAKNICNGFVSIEQPIYIVEALDIVSTVNKRVRKSRKTFNKIGASLSKAIKGIQKALSKAIKHISGKIKSLFKRRRGRRGKKGKKGKKSRKGRKRRKGRKGRKGKKSRRGRKGKKARKGVKSRRSRRSASGRSRRASRRSRRGASRRGSLRSSRQQRGSRRARSHTQRRHATRSHHSHSRRTHSSQSSRSHSQHQHSHQPTRINTSRSSAARSSSSSTSSRSQQRGNHHESHSGKREKRRRRGRSLIGKKGSKSKSESTSTTQAAIQATVSAIVQTATATSPLICTSGQTCVSDKTVVPSSNCGTGGVQCTQPAISFP